MAVSSRPRGPTLSPSAYLFFRRPKPHPGANGPPSANEFLNACRIRRHKLSSEVTLRMETAYTSGYFAELRPRTVTQYVMSSARGTV
jgi:hypothetical protein